MNIISISKMIFNRKALAVAACLLATGAMAQENLNQEITVTHHEDVKPTDAVRLNVTPAVSMPALPSSRLDYGSRQVKVNVPASIASLAPAAYADTIYRSPFRGYASAGYLPAFNLGASAGYKFIDNDRIRLNGWMQYNGVNYRGDLPLPQAPLESARLRRNTATVGASLHSAVGRASFLDLGIDYTFSRFNTPGIARDEATAEAVPLMKNQNVHRLNLSGLWTMNTGKWHTGFGLGYGHFAYGNSIPAGVYPTPPSSDIPLAGFPDLMNPARENRITVNAFASAKVWGAESAGMELKFTYLNYGDRTDYSPITNAVTAIGDQSHGLLSLRPFYRTTWKHIVLDLGLNLDFTMNNGKVFHISPSAQATWKPSDFVTLYIKAKGGERQNTLGSLFDVTCYTMPNMVYGNSHIVVDGEVGLTFGLFKGFYAQLAAGYAVANEWLMPVNIASLLTAFEPIDIKGHKLLFGLGYRYRTLAEISASIETAPRKYDRGYYLWRDRARYVGQLNLRVTPLEPLDITLGWDYRAGRRLYTPTLDNLSMGTVNSINIGATYRLTPQWSVWANVENLFNHRYSLIGALPSQGIGGLAGVSYKF